MALRSNISSATAAVMAVVLVIAASGFAEAQSTDCASKLAVCGQFLKSPDNPSATCCDSIKQAVATQLDCLCNLYSSDAFSSLGVNVTDALHLTKACGVPNDLSNCNKPKQAPGPGNDAEKLVFTGFASLLLLLASLILF